MWVMPAGTMTMVSKRAWPWHTNVWPSPLTVPVVAQVEELVAPLRHDTESIFEEGNDDKKTANGRQVAVERWSG